MLNKLTRIVGIVLIIVVCVWICVYFTVPSHYVRYDKWWTCTLGNTNDYLLFTRGKEKIFRDYRLAIRFEATDCRPVWYLETPVTDTNFDDHEEREATFVFLKDDRVQSVVPARLKRIDAPACCNKTKQNKQYLLVGYNHTELHRQMLINDKVRLDYANCTWVVTITFSTEGYHQAVQAQRLQCMKNIKPAK